MNDNKADQSGRDPELESMLDSLRGDTPTDLEIKRWQRAATGLDGLRPGRKGRSRSMALLAVAAGLGAIAGAGITRQLLTPKPPAPVCAQEELFADVRDIDATFETTYVKLD
jgi:hypothetical protein